MNRIMNATLMAVATIFLLAACKKEMKELGTPGSKVEGITNSWELYKAIQVDEQSLTKEAANILPYFGKSPKMLNITFKDTLYTVDTAGIVLNPFGGPLGTWKFDNDAYPSKITFTPAGGTPFDLKLYGPIRPQDNLKVSREVYHSCKGKSTWVMSFNFEFIRK